MLLEVTCFTCRPAGGLPFVTAGSRVVEYVDAWQTVHAGNVQGVVPYQSSVALP
jgi:hypothetical protein